MSFTICTIQRPLSRSIETLIIVGIMKKKANGCDLKSCFMCQLSLKEWHTAIANHKKNFILELRDQFGQDGNGFINLTLSRQDLAAYTGATYETVFRTLNDLVAERLILTDGKLLGIKDESGLIDLIIK